MHQDPTYVRVSSALEMVASWIALEDIQPDSGELEYYVGSHLLPDYLFEGDKKWMPPGSPEHAVYLRSLHDRSAELGLKRERFLPKKGDVLMWAANLVHGGSKIRNAVSRRSIVTHYCPLNCHPVFDESGVVPEKRLYRDHTYFAVRPR